MGKNLTIQRIATQHKKENLKKRNHQKKQNKLNSKSDKRSLLLDLGLSHMSTKITMPNLTLLEELLWPERSKT